MQRRLVHYHVRVVPNERVEEFTYSGFCNDLPVNIIPIILDENNHFVPDQSKDDVTLPLELRESIAQLEEREFDIPG